MKLKEPLTCRKNREKYIVHSKEDTGVSRVNTAAIFADIVRQKSNKNVVNILDIDHSIYINQAFKRRHSLF